jgi:versiconal hemiacetal acetate esterase
MRENIAAYGGNPSLCYVIGGSAGGNLAIAVALMIISTPGLSPPKAIISSCLSTCEPSVIPEKYRNDWHPEEYLDAAFLNRKCMETCIGRYLGLTLFV